MTLDPRQIGLTDRHRQALGDAAAQRGVERSERRFGRPRDGTMLYWGHNFPLLTASGDDAPVTSLVEFVVPLDDTVVLAHASCTGYAVNPGTTCFVDVLVDGTYRATMSAYFNAANSHGALTAVMFTVFPLHAGAHTWQWITGGGVGTSAATNPDDRGSMTLLAL